SLKHVNMVILDYEIFDLVMNLLELKFLMLNVFVSVSIHLELKGSLDGVMGRSDHLDQSLGDFYKQLILHKKVTSVTTFHNSPAIISGGSEGQVRLWKLGRDSQQIVANMKEHRMAVTVVWVTQDDLECVSSRSDGQMLTWYLTRHIRLKQMIKTANFQGVDYLPVDKQFVACGLDRFAKYFDAFEMKQLREVELSDKELFDIAIYVSEMRYIW
ncbi:MAG: putative WD repeat domain containing protein, partial [Streblomastix strix]